MKRRVVGVVGAVVLALVGTLALVTYVNGAEDRALAGEKTVEVLVAAEAIPAGTPAADLEGQLTFERIPVKVRAEGAVTSISQLGKRVTETDLLPGEQIVRARFVANGAQQGSGGTASANALGATLQLDPARALGGQIKIGDTVAIVVSTTPEGAPPQTQILLHKVTISGVQTDASTPADAAADEETAPGGSLLVTFALDVPSVERLVFAAENAKVWLASEPSEADESGSTAVSVSNLYQ